MSRFSILLGGRLIPTERLRAQVAGTRAIAADGGIVHAAALGLSVELWVGDFDSSSPELMAAHSGVAREVFPVDKDRTDGDIAIAAALARGARSIVLAGSMGGRSDHALGHVALAIRHAREGVPLMLTSGDEEAWPLIGGAPALNLDLPPASPISIVPLSDLEGLTISGVRWPLDQARVALGSTWTLSNQSRADSQHPVTVSLAHGYAMVMAGVRAS